MNKYLEKSYCAMGERESCKTARCLWRKGNGTEDHRECADKVKHSIILLFLVRGRCLISFIQNSNIHLF